MKVDFIFTNTMNLNKKELYEESYITYIICELLYHNPLSKFEIVSGLKELIKSNINNSKISNFLDKLFITDNNIKYSLTSEQELIMSKVIKLKDHLINSNNVQEVELYKQIRKYISYEKFDVAYVMAFILQLDKRGNNQDISYYLSIFFDLMLNKNSYLLKLDHAIDNIDPYYYELLLIDIFDNKLVLDLLFANGIYTVKDLAMSSLEVIYSLISIDYENCMNSISQLKDFGKENLKINLRNLYDSLNEREYKIISLRNGFQSKKMTLEETGQIFSLTRERCRQIESKATFKLVNNSKKIKIQLISLFNYLINQNEKRFISIDVFENYFNDDLLTKYYLFLIANNDFFIKYDSDLNIVYNTYLVSIDDLINEVIERYGIYIYKDDYINLNKFEKSVIKNKYREYYEGFYLLRGYSSKELVGSLIDELFPKGYRIYNQNDYRLLITKYEQIYKTSDVPSDRAICGFLDRLDYCQIDKGTYINRNLCIQLPTDLVDKILNYIILNQSTIYYRSIYEKYKLELNVLGVNNYYYFKGLIDPHLPKDLKTKRNYISCGSNLITAYETIKLFIKSLKDKFSLNDLREKFIGVKDYTFYNVLRNETENGLIPLQNQNFIYVDKVNIRQDTILELKKFIDTSFDLLHVDTLSSKKIYERLLTTNKTLLNNLKIVNDGFSMFSIIKYFFKDNYSFSRPLISIDENKILTTYSLITNYVNSLDSFNLKIINEYISNMKIGVLYSYLSFMEDMSDNFVQINIDTMYKKEKTSITTENLKDFRTMIELIFTSFDFIDTREFNGFYMLPKVIFHWNKYLLVGIIRSYFSNEYQVENTETTYDTTDFIIRKIKKM